jgi:hypothetical protein
MVPGVEGGYTLYFGEREVPAPDKETKAKEGKSTFIYDVCMAYKADGIPSLARNTGPASRTKYSTEPLGIMASSLFASALASLEPRRE